MAASSVGRPSSSGRSLHDTFDGGFVADVILWRKRDVCVGILGVMASVWLLFKRSPYTPLSLASKVLLCLFTILFIWAKSAAILSRTLHVVSCGWDTILPSKPGGQILRVTNDFPEEQEFG